MNYNNQWNTQMNDMYCDDMTCGPYTTQHPSLDYDDGYREGKKTAVCIGTGVIIGAILTSWFLKNLTKE